MAKHQISLVVAIVVSVLVFVGALVFNALAGRGTYPFLESTGNISKAFETQITPAGWTFTIWSVIYIWLIALLVYILSGLCRKNAYGYVYCSPPVLPHGFFLIWCFNFGVNVGWLFLWDRRSMAAALSLLLLITFLNYAMISFSCHGLHIYGAWLNKYHKVDLWLHRVLIQNGLAIYATWTTIASLINLTIELTLDANMSQTNAATVALGVLVAVLFVWFMLENTVFDRHVRYILTIYPVVIWALCGIFTKNYNAAAPSRNDICTAALLAFACALCVARFVLSICRHVTRPLYQDVSAELMEPLEISQHQRKIFK
ncbi:uncharacterized protein LOC142988787 [Genypterus blacodes]|uniref:uncharacterized protein LOC142988787 n=1 Tax=Genypterus blacodes TaxID=154954 RepID=UPI003F75ECCE